MASKSINKKTDQYTHENESIFSPLNPKYTFDHFVVGDCNQFAYEAAKAVADDPSGVYNPLLICGIQGMGSTHLMDAIGHTIKTKSCEIHIGHLSTDRFVRYMEIYQKQNKLADFRDLFKKLDVLLIDDIQFFLSFQNDLLQEQTELSQIILYLLESGKQIVITSPDVNPKEITALDEMFHSYFERGLIVETRSPDFETRSAIIKKKSELQKIAIPDAVIIYLAYSKARNIRELEGMLIRLGAFSNLQNMPITLEMAKESLRDIIGYAGAKIKLAFDIGGVLEKYPTVFLPMISALQNGGTEVFVLTDIPDMNVTQEQLNRYGYSFPPEMILCADFERYGERCKSVLIKEHGIDVLVDDHPGYCADSGCVSLFVWPDPHKTYESQ
jgi:chromosomal replication initiator protein